MTETLRADRVSKSFGDVVALMDVTFGVEPGMTAILGPNGAGKSTLMRLACGLTAPSDGTIRLLGRDPRRDTELARSIGLVPQQEGLFHHLTAREFVRTAALLLGCQDADERAAQRLREVELDPDDRRPTATYSKGMRQRVKVAQALVGDPEVLILDEPLNGLDPRQRLRMIDLFVQLAAEDRTVVVSSHVLAEVERFGSRIVLLARGRVAAEGDFHDIRRIMDDRPHRIRVATNRPRPLAALLFAEEVVSSVSVEGDELIVETTDVSAFRHAIASAARSADALLTVVEPLDDNLESVFRYLVGARR